MQRRPSLLGGLLWTALGALFLLHNFDVGPDVWHIAGRYWPVLLILLGLGKVIDFYRRREGVSIHAGEVIGIIFLLALGTAVTHISRSALPRFPINIGGASVRPGHWLGRSYAYTEDATYPVGSPAKLTIENAYGLVSISPGSDREVRVRLRKVVYETEESRAKRIAEEIQLEGVPEGTVEASALAIRTNRAALSGKRYRFSTDMEILVPKSAQIEVRNSFGEIRAVDLGGALDLSTSHEPLEVRDCTGTFKIANRYGESRLTRLTGAVTVEARGGVYLNEIKGDVDVRNEFERVDVRNVDGRVSVTNTDSSVRLQRISMPVTVQGRGTEITASELVDALTASTSHRPVQVAGAGRVTLNSSFATISLRDVKGPVNIDSNSDRITLEGIQGALQVRAKGSSVHASELAGPADIQTSLKEVVVNNFEKQCTVSNEHGDIRLAAVQLSGEDVTVKTRNGSISLLLPEDAGFVIDATARNGRIRTDFEGLEPVDAPGAVVLKGRLRNDRPRIVLETEYDTIYIRGRERNEERASRNRRTTL
jgi:DUF4097 and DUF4098 domain-containing protein YvlB